MPPGCGIAGMSGASLPGPEAANRSRAELFTLRFGVQGMTSDFIIPDAAILAKEFGERHHLQPSDVVKYERLPIRTSSTANILVNAGYGRLTDDALLDPAVGLLLNLLHRNFELIEAAIVAFVTGCGSAAEVVSRASIESSVNIAFIAAGEPKDRLRAYFDHYFERVDLQVKRWKDQLSALSDEAAELHRKSTERRQKTNNTLRSIIENSMGPAKTLWPKSIEQRFKELGAPLDYRTVYARMSSEVHGRSRDVTIFVSRIAR
jgi:hypothetical protein